ncbi:MAG: flagellar basal body rod protein FlgC [Candidatus Margulisbacteria bacterium]|nr:flagellar basal body rod protein FlgC [Candidatus Margulisiibacteriota bacterium]
MGLNNAMDISVSGIQAQRVTMELIASNIANINTTRTVYGEPYRRRIAVLGENQLSFADQLARAEKKIAAGGVEVVDVVEDSSPFQRVYRPGHPDADAEGFLSLPNVKLSDEYVDLMKVERNNEANITAFNSTKKMMQDTLQLQ